MYITYCTYLCNSVFFSLFKFVYDVRGKYIFQNDPYFILNQIYFNSNSSTAFILTKFRTLNRIIHNLFYNKLLTTLILFTTYEGNKILSNI